ncbi:hypothetical protein [Mycobacterium conspicuum]|uniref:hypothetical protein n=1 Tax=Mycobacterium conspicuum TaxID=44010 RepID=UPI0013D77477|nr:hypothetical protein [Mycobacterium conspicuum]
MTAPAHRSAVGVVGEFSQVKVVPVGHAAPCARPRVHSGLAPSGRIGVVVDGVAQDWQGPPDRRVELTSHEIDFF